MNLINNIFNYFTRNITHPIKHILEEFPEDILIIMTKYIHIKELPKFVELTKSNKVKKHVFNYYPKSEITVHNYQEAKNYLNLIKEIKLNIDVNDYNKLTDEESNNLPDNIVINYKDFREIDQMEFKKEIARSLKCLKYKVQPCNHFN